MAPGAAVRLEPVEAAAPAPVSVAALAGWPVVEELGVEAAVAPSVVLGAVLQVRSRASAFEAAGAEADLVAAVGVAAASAVVLGAVLRVQLRVSAFAAPGAEADLVAVAGVAAVGAVVLGAVLRAQLRVSAFAALGAEAVAALRALGASAFPARADWALLPVSFPDQSVHSFAALLPAPASRVFGNLRPPYGRPRDLPNRPAPAS